MDPTQIATTAISLGSGLIQNIKANKLKKQADAAMPGNVDPSQAAFLSELNQKRKAMDTGAEFAGAMQNIDATNAGTRQGILSASGGNTGSAIQGLLAAQAGADAAKGNVIAQGQSKQLMLNQMYNDLNNQISARSLQLDLLRSQQKRAEWAQKKQAANQNMMAGMTGIAAIGAGLAGKAMPGGIGGGGDMSAIAPQPTIPSDADMNMEAPGAGATGEPVAGALEGGMPDASILEGLGGLGG
jgi:hypothetical protein